MDKAVFDEVRKFYPHSDPDDEAIRTTLTAPGFRHLCERLADESLRREPGITRLYLETLPAQYLEHLLAQARGDETFFNEMAMLGAALARVECGGQDPDEDLPTLAREFAQKVVAEAERRSGQPIWPVGL